MRRFLRHPFVPLTSAIVGSVVAVHEWRYAANHSYAQGPAPWITVVAVAVVIVGLAVAALAWENLDRERERVDLLRELQHLKDWLGDDERAPLRREDAAEGR